MRWIECVVEIFERLGRVAFAALIKPDWYERKDSKRLYNNFVSLTENIDVIATYQYAVCNIVYYGNNNKPIFEEMAEEAWREVSK